MDNHPAPASHPLRPYYRPNPVTPQLNSSSLSSSSSPSPWYRCYWPTSSNNNNNNNSSLAERNDGSSARLVTSHSDVDLPDIADFSRSVIGSFVSGYGRVLVAEPFEVSRMILQAGYYPRNQNGGAAAAATTPEVESQLPRDNDDGDDDDEINYFTAITGDSHLSTSRTRRPSPQHRHHNDNNTFIDKRQVRPHGPYVAQALKAIWALDGPWGIFRGTNITFLHNISAITLESWISAFLSALLSIPDGGELIPITTTTSLPSILTLICASTITGIILAPIDIARTKLILTLKSSRDINHNDDDDKSSLNALKSITQWTCPNQLLLPTTIYKLIPACIGKLGPYFLYNKIGIDPFTSRPLTNLIQLFTSILELFVKLPLETVLRRAQMNYIKSKSTIISIGEYTGITSTMWKILSTEDNGSSGWEGLWRGWRSSLLAIFALWGVQVMGQDQDVANSLPEQI